MSTEYIIISVVTTSKFANNHVATENLSSSCLVKDSRISSNLVTLELSKSCYVAGALNCRSPSGEKTKITQNGRDERKHQ